MRTPLKSIATAALSRPLPILFILIIGAIGVQTITSCSEFVDEPEPSSSSVNRPAENSSSSSKGGSSSYGEPITDVRDGQAYETVVIGIQTWMAKNLNYEAEGSKCYGDNSTNCTLYGRLYDWATAMGGAAGSDIYPSGVQGICPAGFHIPSDMEWTVLTNYADYAGRLRTAYGWNSSNGTDDYGFSALPGGHYEGGFSKIGSEGTWWSATDNGANAYTRNISTGSLVVRSKIQKSDLFSLRCVKNGNSLPPSSSSYNPVPCQSVPAGSFCDDRDGKTYKSVTINNQAWMAENLKFEAEGSLCYGEADLIGSVTSGSEFTTEQILANCGKYGRLYNWASTMGLEYACNSSYCVSQVAPPTQGVCPKGWHVPSEAEFNELIESVGGKTTAGQMLKAQSSWSSGNGMDAYGFSALPGGASSNIFIYNGQWSGGVYAGVGVGGWWWVAKDGSGESNACLSIGTGSGTSYDKTAGACSLRCVKD